MKLLRHLPNFITSLNALCGSLAVVLVLNGDPLTGAYLILLGAAFDFADGFVARILNVTSSIGAELDSLADVITFGLAPGLILLHYIQKNLGIETLDLDAFISHPVLCIALMMPVFGALRLAKFNVDTRQSDSFRGLPIPAAALWVISIPLIAYHMPYHYKWNPESVVVDQWFLIASAVGVSLLMVSDIPLMAMKFKSYAWRGNQAKYIFLIISVVLLIILQPVAIPIILSLYFIISILNNLLSKSK